MSIVSGRNPVWTNAAHTELDVYITFSDLGELLYHATSTDTDPTGAEIWTAASTGVYGAVAAYSATVSRSLIQQVSSGGPSASAMTGLPMMPSVPDVIVEDQRASGTDGGASVAGVNLRTLNTILLNTIGASLASNVLTIPAGYYYARWWAAAFKAGAHQANLWESVIGAVAWTGISAYANVTYSGWSKSDGEAPLLFTTTAQLSIDHFITTATATNGLGYPTSSTQMLAAECYAHLELYKLW